MLLFRQQAGSCKAPGPIRANPVAALRRHQVCAVADFPLSRPQYKVALVDRGDVDPGQRDAVGTDGYDGLGDGSADGHGSGEAGGADAEGGDVQQVLSSRRVAIEANYLVMTETGGELEDVVSAATIEEVV